MECCNKLFLSKKGFTNHRRWCIGLLTHKSSGYDAIHKWVRTHKPKPELCEKCFLLPPMDVANISGEYKRDINDYLYLCRSCHKKMDFTEKTRAKFSLNAQNQQRNERGVFI
jgi:recombinational DNA repair protein RecR